MKCQDVRPDPKHAFGRLKEKVLPDGAVFTYGYDAGSNLSSVKMPGEIEWRASYDLMDRKKSEEIFARNQSVQCLEFNYEKGLLASSLDPLKRLHTYTYDEFNRVAGERVGAHQRTYTYNLLGLLKTAE